MNKFAAQDTPTQIIELTYRYKKHHENIQQIQSLDPRRSIRRLIRRQRLDKEKHARHRQQSLSQHSRNIATENKRLLQRILCISERSQQTKRTQPERLKFLQECRRAQGLRIDQENEQMYKRVTQQRASYSLKSGREEQQIKGRISKFSTQNQRRLQSVIRTLNIQPDEFSCLPHIPYQRVCKGRDNARREEGWRSVYE